MESKDLRLRVVDAHSSGAPCRVVLSGLEEFGIRGRTMAEKQAFMAQELDWLRRSLVTEPRGQPATNVDFILPPCADADVGLVIAGQGGRYPPMSGGNMICVVTVLSEEGVVPVDGDLRIDTPGGIVTARRTVRGGKVEEVAFVNVPSFATHLGEELDVPGLGSCRVDVAYGGMFYLLVEAATFGLSLDRASAGELVTVGERVRAAANARFDVVHPEDPAIAGIHQVLWRGPALAPGNDGRNAVVMPSSLTPAEGAVGLIDRSPCGTGTSALLAVLHARGAIDREEFRHEGLLDEVYTGRVVGETQVGPYRAVMPEIRGRAWITARSEMVLAADDPLRHGFTIADIWPSEALG